MKNIYLVRHGESVANVDPTVYQTTADHAVPLSERGLRQATAAGARLRELIDIPAGERLRVWNSPYKRTRQTAAALLAELKQRFTAVDEKEHIKLCEQQFGLFDGIPEEELPIRFPLEYAHYKRAEDHEGRFWARMPLGESRFDVASRVHDTFGTFLRDSERRGVDNIVVVCHGVTLRAFVMMWRHMEYEWFDREKNPGNCDIYHLPQKSMGSYIYRGGEVL